MNIKRKVPTSNNRSFPKFEQGKVVELFDGGESYGLHIMANIGREVLISLENGNRWSDEDVWGNNVTHAVIVNGSFVEE